MFRIEINQQFTLLVRDDKHVEIQPRQEDHDGVLLDASEALALAHAIISAHFLNEHTHVDDVNWVNNEEHSR